MTEQQSKALHNFTFPVGLRWGKQRFLRCIKVNSDGQDSPLTQFTANGVDSSDHHRKQSIDKRRTTSERDRDKRTSSSEFPFLGSHQMGSNLPPVLDGGRGISRGEDGGFSAVRAIVKLDFPPHPSLKQHSAVMPQEGETGKPWNLRKRRAACKTPVSGVVFVSNGGGVSAAGVGGKALTADGAAEVTDELSRLGSGGNVAAICGDKLKREKFSVALSKREIVEDFLAFTGHKPARRPKKRAKIVQRELDAIFPGLSLTEITVDMYKVSEVVP